VALPAAEAAPLRPYQRQPGTTDLGVILAIEEADPWQKLAAAVLREAMYVAQDTRSTREDRRREAQHFLLTTRCLPWIQAILPDGWDAEMVQQRLRGRIGSSAG
jgi:hypothetical protein